MAKNKEVVFKKRGFGSFLLGFFLGFIFFIVAVAGVGFYAYKNVSVNNIEKITGVNVPIYDELKSKPLENVINLTIDLVKDNSALTLSKIEDTFGIVNSLTGNSIPVGIKNTSSGYVYVYSTSELDSTYLDISVFANTSISNLTNEAQSFIKNLSLVDIQKLATFDLPDIPVINNVKTKPLMDALKEISETLNFDTLTLRDLKTEFDVDLTNIDALKDFLDIPFNGEGTNNLEYALNNATIANFVGLTKLESETQQEYEFRLQESSILGILSKYKIVELSEKVNSLTLGNVMGLDKKIVRSGTEGNYSYSEETTQEYNNRIKDAKLLGALKDARIDNLSQAIDDLDIPHKSISQLEEWGLIDLSDLTQADKERISSKTITEIINEYATLTRSI